jgi:hypothetical protein
VTQVADRSVRRPSAVPECAPGVAPGVGGGTDRGRQNEDDDGNRAQYEHVPSRWCGERYLAVAADDAY